MAECRAEQADDGFAAAHDGMSFAEVYRTFGRCVADKATGERADLARARLNAARTCFAERKADAEGFRGQYRAFGACVSKTAES